MKAVLFAFRSFLILAILFSFGFSVAPNRSAQAAPSEQKVAWSPCYQEMGAFECATVQVPLDYTNPGKATIAIALVRQAAGDSANKIGSLFFNPGGPGGSGVEFVLFVGPYLYTDEVRQKFDIIGFDPRGVGRSTALRCFGNPRQWYGYFTPFAFPMTDDEQAIWEAADAFLTSACVQRGSKIIDYMTTANVARDLDLLREAVVDEQLSYVGFSYGTFLGQVYANLFPDKVRAVVIDGVLDPIAWTTGEPGQEDLPFSTRLRSDLGAQASLEEFFRLCDENPATCPFASDIPSADRYAALAESLKAAPLPLPQDDGSVYNFTYQDLISNSLGAMYDSFSWPDFANFLAYLDSTASPAEIAAKLEAFRVDAGLINKRGFPHYPNYVEAFPGVACADSDNPDSYAAWAAAAAAGDADGYFGRLWTWLSSICVDWPTEGVGRYMGPFTTATANPVLVVGNSFDPATRYEGAQKAASLLPNARLLTMDGWGHCSLFFSQCADAYVSEYLLTGALPPEGTVCQQDLTPFVDFGLLTSGEPAFQVRRMLNAFTLPDVVIKGGRSAGPR